MSADSLTFEDLKIEWSESLPIGLPLAASLLNSEFGLTVIHRAGWKSFLHHKAADHGIAGRGRDSSSSCPPGGRRQSPTSRSGQRIDELQQLVGEAKHIRENPV
jgi:hypothetical protein